MLPITVHRNQHDFDLVSSNQIRWITPLSLLITAKWNGLADGKFNSSVWINLCCLLSWSVRQRYLSHHWFIIDYWVEFSFLWFWTNQLWWPDLTIGPAVIDDEYSGFLTYCIRDHLKIYGSHKKTKLFACILEPSGFKVKFYLKRPIHQYFTDCCIRNWIHRVIWTATYYPRLAWMI
jgi:hypothetical protein